MRSLIVLAAGLSLICSASAQVTTNYKYDTLGRLIRSEVPGGNNTCYAYDSGHNRTLAKSTCGPPTAANDYYVKLATGATWSGPLNVLSNDTDPDLPGEVLTITSIGGIYASYLSIAPGGTSIQANNLPLGVFTGPFAFTYAIKDTQNATSAALLEVEVNCRPRSTC